MNALVGHANTWYVEMVNALLTSFDRVEARGRWSREQLHVMTHLPDPRRRVLTVPYRRANPFFQAAEVIWILAGRSDAAWICRYNKQLGRYLDTAVPNPGYFHGAYGERLCRWGRVEQLGVGLFHPIDQLQGVLAQLRQDPGSRRAVAVLHNPLVDHVDVQTADRPCNIAASYQLRDGRLHAATFNRSNDLTLGLAFTNIAQFTTIQEVLAAALGVQPGGYTHFSSSLHVYEDDAIARRCWERWARTGYVFDVYAHVDPVPMRELFDGVNTPKGFTLMEALTARPLAVEPKDIACPYWRDMCRLLWVWEDLRAVEGDPPEGAAEGVGQAGQRLEAMVAQDWAIAAWEYLHRWAARRGALLAFNNALARLPWPPSVLRYITHDHDPSDDAPPA